MKTIGYAILLVTAAVWFLCMIVGLIRAFPEGLLGLAAIVGLGFLFVRALADRLQSKEDDYYSKNVDQ